MKMKIIFTILNIYISYFSSFIIRCQDSQQNVRGTYLIFLPSRETFSAANNIVHWWKEVSRNERESDWLTWKETPSFTRIFVFTVVFVTYTNPTTI